MPTVVADVHALLKILDSNAVGQMRLVAIDGAGGAGKSTLGAQLAAAFDGAVHVDLDRFLVEKRNQFFTALLLDEVKAAITAGDRLVIVSRICMLRVLEALDVRPDVLIYLKRMRTWGWADEDELYGDEIEQTAAALGVHAEEWPFQLEVREYHQRYRPHECAAIILERREVD